MYVCKTCNQAFSSFRGLGGHRRRHLNFRLTFEQATSDRTRKRCLIEERGHQCEVCQNTTWQEQPIPLEMDHIDGNPENSQKENLRLICPNCHAQTDTYRGKNVGKVVNSKRQRTMKRYVGLYR